MNPRLQQIMRNVERKHPPVEKAQPAGDLGSAIEQLIQQQVEERVSAELDKHRERLQQHSPRVQQLLRDRPAPSSESPPPAPKTPLPGAVITRGEDGRAATIAIGSMQFRVMRDELGRIQRMVPADSVPPQPAIEPVELAGARQYREPEPR